MHYTKVKDGLCVMMNFNFWKYSLFEQLRKNARSLWLRIIQIWQLSAMQIK